MDEIRRFERMLADDRGASAEVLVPSVQKRQRERLKALEADPKTRWRVTPTRLGLLSLLQPLLPDQRDTIRQTNLPWAPWTIVGRIGPELPGGDRRPTCAAGGDARASGPGPGHRLLAPAQPLTPLVRSARDTDLLSQLDLSVSMSRKKFDTELAEQQRLAC